MYKCGRHKEEPIGLTGWEQRMNRNGRMGTLLWFITVVHFLYLLNDHAVMVCMQHVLESKKYKEKINRKGESMGERGSDDHWDTPYHTNHLSYGNLVFPRQKDVVSEPWGCATWPLSLQIFYCWSLGRSFFSLHGKNGRLFHRLLIFMSLVSPARSLRSRYAVCEGREGSVSCDTWHHINHDHSVCLSTPCSLIVWPVWLIGLRWLFLSSCFAFRRRQVQVHVSEVRDMMARGKKGKGNLPTVQSEIDIPIPDGEWVSMMMMMINGYPSSFVMWWLPLIG